MRGPTRLDRVQARLGPPTRIVPIELARALALPPRPPGVGTGSPLARPWTEQDQRQRDGRVECACVLDEGHAGIGRVVHTPDPLLDRTEGLLRLAATLLDLVRDLSPRRAGTPRRPRPPELRLFTDLLLLPGPMWSVPVPPAITGGPLAFVSSVVLDPDALAGNPSVLVLVDPAPNGTASVLPDAWVRAS